VAFYFIKFISYLLDGHNVLVRFQSVNCRESPRLTASLCRPVALNGTPHHARASDAEAQAPPATLAVGRTFPAKSLTTDAHSVERYHARARSHDWAQPEHVLGNDILRGSAGQSHHRDAGQLPRGRNDPNDICLPRCAVGGSMHCCRSYKACSRIAGNAAVVAPQRYARASDGKPRFCLCPSCARSPAGPLSGCRRRDRACSQPRTTNSRRPSDNLGDAGRHRHRQRRSAGGASRRRWGNDRGLYLLCR
jgi:hypothetical protein